MEQAQQIRAWRLNFDSSAPIYSQIIANFARAIVREELHIGERIPSIRDLATELKVNTNTVARAYQEMERDGLIYSQRGTGYFVMESNELRATLKEQMLSKAVEAFFAEMHSLGFTNSEIKEIIVKEADKS